MKKRFWGLLATGILLGSSSYAAADTIELPPDNGGSNGFSRGYYFVAPTAFTITGISVLEATGTEYAEIIRINQPPSVFPASTSNFTVLNYVSGTGSAILPIMTTVSTGDIIGVLGYDSGFGGIHYGDQPFTSSIAGIPTELSRLLTQQDLTFPAGSVSTEGPAANNNLGLVQLEYTTGSVTSAVPESSTWAMMLLGFGGLGLFGYRKARRGDGASAAIVAA